MFYNTKLSSKEICEIVETSIENSAIDGFFNPLGVDILMNLYSAMYIFNDRREEIQEKMIEDAFDEYDSLVKDGTFKEMYEKYPEDMKMVNHYKDVWYDKYSNFTNSAQSIISAISQVLSSDTDNLVKNLSDAMSNENLSSVLDVVNKWGMNKDTPSED